MFLSDIMIKHFCNKIHLKKFSQEVKISLHLKKNTANSQ